MCVILTYIHMALQLESGFPIMHSAQKYLGADPAMACCSCLSNMPCLTGNTMRRWQLWPLLLGLMHWSPECANATFNSMQDTLNSNLSCLSICSEALVAAVPAPDVTDEVRQMLTIIVLCKHVHVTACTSYISENLMQHTQEAVCCASCMHATLSVMQLLPEELSVCRVTA